MRLVARVLLVIAALMAPALGGTTDQKRPEIYCRYSTADREALVVRMTLDGDLDGLGSGLASDAVEVELGALADNLPPRITGLRVEPPRITPDGDGRDDRAEITADFADDRAGGRVRLEVLGPGGPVAYRLTPRAGDSATISFDGRDDRGRLLPEGLYRLRVVPIDAAGNEGLGMQGELEIQYPVRIWEFGP